MSKKPLMILIGAALLGAGLWSGLLFAGKNNNEAYRMRVEKGQGIASVARNLEQNHIVYSRHVLLGTAYLMGIHNKLHTGNYKLPKNVSAWQILQRLKSGRPDTITVRIPEGGRFAQMRQIIGNTTDLTHESKNWSNSQLLQKIAPDADHSNPEGLFAPDSYEIDTDSSDLQLYQLAYKTMQRNLQSAWENRQSGLPYTNPYDLLTMASIIEKETGHTADRRDVAAVFTNRLNIGMRLQTDPSVIYGMGEAYQGKIRKADLQRDTPYNTYTRAGLPPTPISLPSKAALEAAAHPSNAKYLYFVSKMDGSGRSQFSYTLEEHNAAVRKYILKKP